ncbi:hypothetical protein FF011L_42360 [Roseimaritima multifibrata]|uniref:Uncharacterized protein n=1 Tax=Roseimaritima multifibrata TaxID=1930274 RepID=A0A517MKS7_9BACT|nr:hypothetical protein FF011L_42360 [Roseimaritima multifibrata]
MFAGIRRSFLLMMFAFAVPCGVFFVPAPVLTMASGTQTTLAEDIHERPSLIEEEQVRRCHVAEIRPWEVVWTQAAKRHGSFFLPLQRPFTGHRLANGIRAPLRC